MKLRFDLRYARLYPGNLTIAMPSRRFEGAGLDVGRGVALEDMSIVLSEVAKTVARHAQRDDLAPAIVEHVRHGNDALPDLEIGAIGSPARNKTSRLRQRRGPPNDRIRASRSHRAACRC